MPRPSTLHGRRRGARLASQRLGSPRIGPASPLPRPARVRGPCIHAIAAEAALAAPRSPRPMRFRVLDRLLFGLAVLAMVSTASAADKHKAKPAAAPGGGTQAAANAAE